MIAWPSAPAVAWARTRPTARHDLAASDLLPVTAAEWPAMLEADDRDRADGAPSQEATLSDAIAAHCGVDAERVLLTVGSSGANFLAMAALLRPGDGVVVEDPGYAPLDTQTLQAIGASAEETRIHVLVDEVYLDTAIGPAPRAAAAWSGSAAAGPWPHLAWLPPAAGPVAFPCLRRVANVDAFVDRLLDERRTAVVPGRFFGHPQHVRVAFGMARDELAGGLELTAGLDAVAPVETTRS